MARKGLMKCLPTNIPDLEEPLPIFLLTKANKITIGPAIDVSTFPPGFMLQMDFVYFNVEFIRLFTSTFVDICYDISYPFGFPYRSKWTPLDILKLIFIKFRKMAFIRVVKDVALARSSGSMMTFHNMNIIFQNTGGDTSSLNGKI